MRLCVLWRLPSERLTPLLKLVGPTAARVLFLLGHFLCRHGCPCVTCHRPLGRPGAVFVSPPSERCSSRQPSMAKVFLILRNSAPFLLYRLEPLSPLLRPSPSPRTRGRHCMTPSPVERWTATLSESWRSRKTCTMSCRQSPVFIDTTSVGSYPMALQPECCAFFGTCVNDGRGDLSCSVGLGYALTCFCIRRGESMSACIVSVFS